VRKLIEEDGKRQDHPTSRLVGRPSGAVKVLCNSRVAITNTVQRNHPPDGTFVCVHFAAREKAQCISVPDGPVHGASFCRISHQGKFVNIVNSVCHDKTGIQGAPDLLHQPELCD